MRLGTTQRRILAGLAAGALVAGVWISLGATRLTVHNSAMTVDYPGNYAIGAALAAAAAFALAALAGDRRLRYAALLAGSLGLVHTAERVTYRLEASNDGLRTQAFGITRNLPWQNIAQVTVGVDGTFVVMSDERRIAMDTGLPPEQAAIINRTVARHVREAGESLRGAP
jgi:hypothetical protein